LEEGHNFQVLSALPYDIYKLLQKPMEASQAQMNIAKSARYTLQPD